MPQGSVAFSLIEFSAYIELLPLIEFSVTEFSLTEWSAPRARTAESLAPGQMRCRMAVVKYTALYSYGFQIQIGNLPHITVQGPSSYLMGILDPFQIRDR